MEQMNNFNWAQKHLDALENNSKQEQWVKEGYSPMESRAERRKRERSEHKQLKKAAKV